MKLLQLLCHSYFETKERGAYFQYGLEHINPACMPSK